jgi:uncharacterized protein YijF (DUF1287 family)
MKHMITMITALQMTFGGLMAGEADLILKAKDLLAQIENQAPKEFQPVGYFEENFRGDWGNVSEFAQLKELVSANWKDVLGNIEGIAGTSEIHQYILFRSFCFLPQKESFQCLNKVADLCLENVISKEMFKWARDVYEIYTAPTYRLSFYYEDPVVIEILRKAKIIQPEMAEHYDRMLSGEESKDLIVWFEESGETKPAYLDDLLAQKQGADATHEVTAEKTQSASSAEKTPVPVPALAAFADAIDDIGLAIVAAARSQIGKTEKYDPSYVRLEYPMGDIPIETGVCTDVIIRALREALNMDLQQLIHEDMRNSFLLYPKKWGLKLPDKSIDHRRVLNQKKYFERKGFSVPISDKAEDYQPGDIITCGLPHIMIVSDKKNERGIPLVIHNIGRGTREESNLFVSDITGHYRITHKGRQSILNNVVVFVGVVIIISGIIVPWRYFKKKVKMRS